MPNQLTITGNLTADPEIQYTQNGKPYARLTIADAPRHKDQNGNWQDGETLFQHCTAWGTIAENITDSLTKGNRVTAHGTLRANKYTDKNGVERYSTDLQIDEIAPSLKWATAKPVRNQQGNGNGAPQQQQGWGQPPQQQGAAWATQNDPWGNQNNTPAPF